MESGHNGKAELWRQRIEAQRTSGQSVRAWCAANDIREHSFYFWRVRLGLSAGKRRRDDSAKIAASPGGPLLARVKIVESVALEPLRLRLRGDRELILPASMALEQVARLVHAIEATT